MHFLFSSFFFFFKICVHTLFPMPHPRLHVYLFFWLTSHVISRYVWWDLCSVCGISSLLCGRTQHTVGPKLLHPLFLIATSVVTLMVWKSHNHFKILPCQTAFILCCSSKSMRFEVSSLHLCYHPTHCTVHPSDQWEKATVFWLFFHQSSSDGEQLWCSSQCSSSFIKELFFFFKKHLGVCSSR